jgi:hypothetical protein
MSQTELHFSTSLRRTLQLLSLISAVRKRIARVISAACKLAASSFRNTCCPGSPDTPPAWRGEQMLMKWTQHADQNVQVSDTTRPKEERIAGSQKNPSYECNTIQ